MGGGSKGQRGGVLGSPFLGFRAFTKQGLLKFLLFLVWLLPTCRGLLCVYQGCKKFFFRSKHKISYWKIAPATAKIRSIFGGFWPISTVTWLELVLLIKFETDLTDFAYKWPHMFRKLMPILKNRSGWWKFAPSNARVLTDFLHPWCVCFQILVNSLLATLLIY